MTSIDKKTRERSALEVLRKIEWDGVDCPVCGAFELDGHAPDCALDAVLRSTPASDGGEVRERVAFEVWAGMSYPDERDRPEVREVWRRHSNYPYEFRVRNAYITADRILAALRSAPSGVEEEPDVWFRRCADGVSLGERSGRLRAAAWQLNEEWARERVAAELPALLDRLPQYCAAPVPAREGEEDGEWGPYRCEDCGRPIEEGEEYDRWADDVRTHRRCPDPAAARLRGEGGGG